MDQEKIAILGAGSWGTALAFLLGGKGAKVTLWDRDDILTEQIRTLRRNPKYLPDTPLAETVDATSVMKQALDEVTHLNGKLQNTLGTLTQAQEKLYDKVLDLEKFEEVVVGRELEMIKIKRELENTKKELAQLKQNSPGQTLPR